MTSTSPFVFYSYANIKRFWNEDFNAIFASKSISVSKRGCKFVGGAGVYFLYMYFALFGEAYQSVAVGQMPRTVTSGRAGAV